MASSSMRTMTMTVVACCCACTPDRLYDEDTGIISSGQSTGELGASTGTTSDLTGTSTVTSTSGLTESSTDPTASTLDGTTDTPACGLPPVEQTVLDQLSITAPGLDTSVAAGDTQLSLVWIDFGTPTTVDACVEWSLEPVDGVSIDDTGVLTVDAAVAAGTVISVTADVEAGRRILTADFEVYVPVTSDIIGFWTEVEQLPCDGGAPFVPDPIIGELVFEDTGEFSVTWTPFEVYYDYWGTYTYDEGTGALMLTVDGGNYVPADIDGEGTATVTGGQLTLQDMWLGVAQEPMTPVACGHVLD